MDYPARAVNEQRETLRAALAHTGPLETTEVRIPGSTTTVQVTRPVDTDRLLDQVMNDPEQNLPYWSEIWPSGIALAGAIIRQPDELRGKRVLELGSGLGITAAVALMHGANLTVTDYAPESLVLTELTCLDNTGMAPAALRQINWRSPSVVDLADPASFDVVLAADALYEQRDVEPLFAAVETLLSPYGTLWLAEPGRAPAQVFLRGMNARGWNGPHIRWRGPWPDPRDEGIEVRTHLLRRAP